MQDTMKNLLIVAIIALLSMGALSMEGTYRCVYVHQGFSGEKKPGYVFGGDVLPIAETFAKVNELRSVDSCATS